jgi:hypothetical protein
MFGVLLITAQILVIRRMSASLPSLGRLLEDASWSAGLQQFWLLM